MDKAYKVVFNFGTGNESHIVLAKTEKAAVNILSKQSGYNMWDYLVRVIELKETA